MADKKGFGEVKTSTEELNAQIKAHRRSKFRRIGLVLLLIALVVAGLELWSELRTYTKYEITNILEQGDKSASHFADFNGNILEYSNDGMSYADGEGNLIWNCPFEMSSPMVDICKDYVTVYDKNGTEIYVYKTTGEVVSIETPMPICTVCVAAQGTVAALMKNGTDYTVKLYDTAGKELAGGEFYGDQGSIPVDIAFSYDAKKLAVDLIDITGGTVDSMISFYNFGDVGQNEINNNVGSYTYQDTLIPQIEYVSENIMYAVGDKSIKIFGGAQKPELKKEIEFEQDIASCFIGGTNVGIIYSNNDGDGTRHLEVYNSNGSKTMEADTSIIYENVEFLSNNEICLTNDTECQIYTMHGIKKFDYKFDKEIYKILHDKGNNNYIFISNGATEEVRLK